MKILARLIKRQLQLDVNKWGHCAIYEDELRRVWPINDPNRRASIEHFAKQQGFRLVFYKQGLCAMFEEEQKTKKRRENNG